MDMYATTIAGIAFWGILLGAYVALFGATLVGICRSSLESRARTRWIWFVVLAPGLGVMMWFVRRRQFV
ncbi:hypothetical protein ACTI_50190 [Actinoplanes sp. OR16]|uniref:hypothetical protein n=1 Tax=Actinoplanes sp. OR16 TaxID=946334 RepID=UPI000F6FF41B|nr:hypothetical protein [Actinoplanes sp. OR16]BBH68334.1 hypothetical protein ACTI_50190 [Actinoplanes sp. OR16]